MEVYNGMSGKQLREWRKANRFRGIEEMKKATLQPPVELSPEEEGAAKELIRSSVVRQSGNSQSF